MGSWSGCCGRVAAVAALCALLAAAHANSVMENGTESASASAMNRTSLLAEVEEAKLNEMTEAFKSVGNMFLHLRAGRKPRDGGEQGSGEPLEEFPVVTSAPEETTAETVDMGSPKISQDSAETDHLLPHDNFMEEEELRPHVFTESSWHVPKVTMETTVEDLDRQESLTTQSPAAPPSKPVTVKFDIDSRKELFSPSPSAHEFQGRDPTAWAMPDNYDYLTPYDDTVSSPSDEYSTTAETYEDELTTTPPPRPFQPRFPSPFNPTKEEGPRVGISSNGADCRLGYVRINGTCRSQCDTLPSYCFNGGQCYVLDGIGVFCRCNIQDYMWHKGARCESVITEFQVMCIAIGASALTVLLLFMIIVCFAKKLHVLKTENNKLRKRSKYRPSSEQHNDNFSLSTIAEGSHPNVRKLCDTPPVLPHARALAYYDNIICQKTMSRYTWECKTKEESGCEDDPNAQNKLEDPVKAPPPKEDESLNIQNSLTPKHENHKMLGEENSSEVNSLQNNMM
ncbi:chondroitin sulfate proteoglycan 5 isoform X2 [Pygocentrus nattereri]|uniref:chondroitin sulfate proteoglycan 5 isoform X2 n=1 Tax=Pygocentrus nattereri TaxID=42514 RepID=UPI001891A405|nr:chondroitin sulfate proteoglycan 5 isoform X2 [Pygocentrus nattereri]